MKSHIRENKQSVQTGRKNSILDRDEDSSVQVCYTAAGLRGAKNGGGDWGGERVKLTSHFHLTQK